MATASIYPSASRPRYDVHPNDFIDQNYQVPINGGFNMASQEFLYPQSFNEVLAPTAPYSLPLQQPNNLPYFRPPQMGPAQTFPTNGFVYERGYNGGMAPAFQMYPALPPFQTPAPSFTTTPSLASSSSTSFQNGLTPSPIPFRKEVHKANPKLRSKGKRSTRAVHVVTKRQLLIGKPKRKRGPNRRPPGTAFSNLLDGLQDEVKEALDQEYKGCCETVNTKDVSTKQKHMFSNRHCKNLPQKYQDKIPNFVCPAFVAFKSNCRAKAGRYDSTDRHCRNCDGFDQLNKGNKVAVPVVITRAQYNAILNYRMGLTAYEGGKQATNQSTEQADNLVRSMILADVFKDGLPDWFPDFNREDKSDVPDATKTQPLTSVSVAPVANHVEQPPPQEPSPLDRADECAGVFKKGFPVNSHEGLIGVSDANVRTTVSSSPSMSDPVANHSEQLSLYESSQSTEAFNDGFPTINPAVKSGISDAILVASSQSSTLSLPVSVSNNFGRSPSVSVSEEEIDYWGPFSDFLRN